MKQSGWRLLAKAAFDRSVAGVSLLAATPVIAASALVIRASMGPGVLFAQQRPGRGGRLFTVYKLRTMRSARAPGGGDLPDAQRLTPVGAFLRSTSIDELPQLWNVLRGDISLVGPRPLLVQYLPRYSPGQARRHEVLPGITGWAQVNGRNAISWEEKFELDIWYVDNWSLALDLKILAMTLARVFQRSGISREGHATMPEFMGSASTEDGK